MFAKSHSTIATNHFELQLKPETRLYEYQLQVSSGELSEKKTKELMQDAIDSSPYLRKPKLASDNISTIISWSNLHRTIPLGVLKETPSTSSKVGSVLGPLELTHRDGTKGYFKLRFTREIEYDALLKHVRGDATELDRNVGPTIKALNVLMSKAISGDTLLTRYTAGNVAQVSANKFFLGAQGVSLTTSLCAIRGFYYTAKPGMNKVLLNVNSGTTTFFGNITVAEFLRDASTFRETNAEQRQDMLIGRRVLINYGRVKTDKARSADESNNARRVKTIFRFGKDTIDKTEIAIDEGVDGQEVLKNCSVKDYLSKRKSLHPIVWWYTDAYRIPGARVRRRQENEGRELGQQGKSFLVCA